MEGLAWWNFGRLFYIFRLSIEGEEASECETGMDMYFATGMISRLIHLSTVCPA